MRRALAVALGLVLLLGAYAAGRASERDEVTLTVEVNSSDHEVIEGYFSLGDVTVMVRPGSPLHRFLSRQRGREVTLTLTEGAVRELSRLDRE